MAWEGIAVPRPPAFCLGAEDGTIEGGEAHDAALASDAVLQAAPTCNKDSQDGIAQHCENAANERQRVARMRCANGTQQAHVYPSRANPVNRPLGAPV